MHIVNYNHLYYFYLSATEGTFKGAASKLRLSPSTISEQIAALEEYFGKKLFHRGKGHLKLTVAGEKALRFAKTIFDAGERLEQTLKDEIKLDRKNLEIGVTPAVVEIFEKNLFVPLIENPDIKVKLHVGEANVLSEELYSYSLDLLISHEELLGRKDGLGCEVLQEPRYFVVAGSKYRNRAKSFPRCLNEIPFLSYTNHTAIRWELDHFFLSRNIQPNTIAEIDDIGIMKVALMNNIGFGILSAEAVAAEVRRGELFILKELEDLEGHVYAYFHKKDISHTVQNAIRLLTKRQKNKES